MKAKFRIISALVLITGLVVGWNLQNQEVVNALLGSNTFISRSTSAGNTNGNSINPTISHDGRYIVFESNASNLVAGDTNAYNDIFLKDTVANTTTIVSVDSSGNQSNHHSSVPTISGDGKFVVYTSRATNLVTGDTNGVDDIFRYNVTTGATERVSTSTSGTESNGHSNNPDVDSEGRFVVFDTLGTNLTSVSDTNSTYDVIVKDMTTGTSTLVSQSDAGVIGSTSSYRAKISCDGRFIVFASLANNLTLDVHNGWMNIFLTDMLGTQTVSSITKSADQSNMSPDISCNGLYVGFSSRASNLGANPNTAYATYDALRYNRSTQVFDGISTRENGSAPTDASYLQAISSDGRYAIFSSNTNSFVTTTSDTNNKDDLFLRDMNSTGFKVISKTPSGSTGNDISPTGNFSGTNRIVFSSTATDLVTGVSDSPASDIFIADAGTPNTCTF